MTFEALPTSAPPPSPQLRRFFNNIFTVFFRPGESNYIGIAPWAIQARYQAEDGLFAYQSKGNFWNRRGDLSNPFMRCLTFVQAAPCVQREFATLAALQKHASYHALGWEQCSREGDPGYQRIGGDGAMRETDRLRLSASSAARGAGLPLPAGLPDPLAPSGGAPDMGAFQAGQGLFGVGVDGAQVF